MNVVDRKLRFREDFKNVEELNFQNIPGYQITDEYLAGWHHLLRLNLDYWDRFSRDAFRSLLDRCPGLTHVSLSGCNQLVDSDIAYMALKCPHLEDLNIAECDQLGNVVVKLNRLATLDLHWCRNLQHLHVVQENGGVLKGVNLGGCRHLTRLELPPSVESINFAYAAVPPVWTVPTHLKEVCLINVECTIEQTNALLSHLSSGAKIEMTDCKLTIDELQDLVTEFPQILFKVGVYLNGANVTTAPDDAPLLTNAG